MRLVLTFTDSQMTKMQRGDDEKSGVMRSSALSNDVSGANPAPLSHLEYPLVKYWEKKVWKNVAGTRKDTSEVETKGGARGGTRSLRGENVMMLYIEDTNGMPVDGNIASDMRECYSASKRALESQRTKGTAEEEIRLY